METKNDSLLRLILIHARHAAQVEEALKTNRDLSPWDRKILRGFLFMRENQNEKALTAGTSAKRQEDPFRESIRLYLIGCALNNTGRYREAMAKFSECHELLPKELSVHLEFAVLDNLFLIHMNLHQLGAAREIMTVMQVTPHLKKKDFLRLHSLQFGHAVLSQDPIGTQRGLDFIGQHYGEYDGYEKVSLLINLYHYGIVSGNYEHCDRALDEWQKQKKYAISQNYIYMKTLLDHLRDKTPIQVKDDDFKGYRTLLTELKFLRALDEERLSELPALWNELILINPQSFQDDYRFTGFPSVFSKCLELHAHKLNGLQTKTIKEERLSILDAIEQKLRQEERVTKEQLFYYVYGRELETKVDHTRISKYVNKLKTSKKLKIRSVRGAYQLFKKAP